MVATPWHWQFPPIAEPLPLEEQIASIIGEVVEALEALQNGEGYERVAEELMDVKHRTESAIRNLPFDDDQLTAIKRGVIEKNDRRGYYGGE
ncbi:MAG: hypothetical protein IKV48_07005 [Eggerthellaceae bacterium]|nr:hypothetical protein [Eggerthellaceae bacterium]